MSRELTVVQLYRDHVLLTNSYCIDHYSGDYRGREFDSKYLIKVLD